MFSCKFRLTLIHRFRHLDFQFYPASYLYWSLFVRLSAFCIQHVHTSSSSSLLRKSASTSFPCLWTTLFVAFLFFPSECSSWSYLSLILSMFFQASFFSPAPCTTFPDHPPWLLFLDDPSFTVFFKLQTTLLQLLRTLLCTSSILPPDTNFLTKLFILPNFLVTNAMRRKFVQNIYHSIIYLQICSTW